MPIKANRSPLSLYFLCCFRCVHTDTEQVGQSSSKAILYCLNTDQNGYLQTRVRIQHRQVTLEAENYGRTVGQKHESRTVDCPEFSNPQLPFPNIHLSETSLFQTAPACPLCHLSPSSPVACPEMNGSDGDRILLLYPGTVEQTGRGVCPDKCYSISRNFHLTWGSYLFHVHVFSFSHI